MKASSLGHEVSKIDLALCRATLYSALALGFRSPTGETITRLTSQESAAALADAAAFLDAHPHPYPLPFRARESTLSNEKRVKVRRDLGLTSAVRSLSQTEGISMLELSASYYRLFGHTARPTVPPYETEYGAEALFQQPMELGDLTGFYRAFGLTLNLEEHERPDHISCELEFLSFLTLKEAYALEHGDDSMAKETRKAQRLFLRDHLGRFVSAFVKKLAREDRDGFYGTLGELCLRFVTQECSRFGVTAGSENLTLRPPTDDRVPMACGSGAECTALPGACGPLESEA